MQRNLARIVTILALPIAFWSCTQDEPYAEEPVMASAPPAPPMMDMASSQEGGKTPEWNTERYRVLEESGFHDPAMTPYSTFAIDVDTAGYALVRRFLTQGQMPPNGAVRIEEMLNYFNYQYAPPKAGDQPFAVHTTVATAPWAAAHRLVRIGIKGKDVATEDVPPANLVFLVDVSGSMSDPSKLPLLQRSLTLLADRLRSSDTVGIVVYAGAASVVLEPTSNKRAILSAIESLQPGGSTNGEAGIETAYRLAQEHFLEKGINRVILATDGDFNVGASSDSALVGLIAKKAENGIFLTALGFGAGNYNDAMMEQIADRGNGAYAYIDTIDEGRKVLVEQLTGTLMTIAKDVKIQVSFNRKLVESYRLIGYENRAMAAEDFKNDRKDAGEIGAGHTVTALYEIVTKPGAARTGDKELLTVNLRYKLPDGAKSTLLKRIVKDESRPLAKTDTDFRFAAAVAGFGMKLRGSEHAKAFAYDEILALAKSGLGDDENGLRAEFLGLVRKAESLSGH